MAVLRSKSSPSPTRRPRRRRAAALTTTLAAALTAGLLAAATAPVSAAPGVSSPASDVTIDSVGGASVAGGQAKSPLTGTVPVSGTATTADGPAAEPAEPAPLVADAGDSPFVKSGEQGPLMGAGYGGTEPYTFAWTSGPGSIDGADAPTAAFDATGVPAGRYPVTLTVTDFDGATSSDQVVVVVYEQGEQTLLEESREDATPGATGVSEPIDFPFEVPAGVTSMTVDVTWEVPANDYDLVVLDPSGSEAGSSGNAPPEFEHTSVDSPAAGTWTVRVNEYATVVDTVTAKVVATTSGVDPRPTVDAGGPYTVVTGNSVTLDGTVSGGTSPVETGWDTDEDGRLDASGTDVTLTLPEGRHLVTLKATDADGLERRQMTSVLVANPDRLAEETTAVTVVGVADSGINPYHLEFSAQTYPDPDVLALTDNFTRHPSEYIPGYPADATALDITLGEGYFPEADAPIWNGNETIQPGRMYWIPGTKIVGAVDAGGSTGVTSGDDTHPILDDNGHGSGSASVSTGNRYGYCPTCLLVVVEALDESVVAALPWVDISTNSFGYIGGAPLGLVGDPQATKAAAERGQTTLFAAGNGVGNAFDVPVSTYGSDQTGPDWNVTVGALRRDNQRAIVGDGIPVHLSSWGDGNLPSACRTGTVGQCAFGGTSAATPYTAGVFGTVLTKVREAVGDGRAGQKPGQVVAKGIPVDQSEYLADGELTRAELRTAVLKNAFPLNTENEMSPFPYPATAPYTGDTNVLFEGYGAATPETAQRAVDVLLGRSLMPERGFEDDFFALDRQVRDSLYGGYDRDGDGQEDSEAPDGGLPLEGLDLATMAGGLAALRAASESSASAAAIPASGEGQQATTFYLHRRHADAPGIPEGCSTSGNENYLSTSDTTGDLEPCFESRVTSVVAAFRPLGIFPSEGPATAPTPTGSRVYAEIYLAGETPSVIRPTGVLMAGDREIGRGEGSFQPVVGSGPGGTACTTLGESCWTKYVIAFETSRPAFAGEQVTFQVQMVGARSWAFGFEGAHASRVTVVAAPADDLEGLSATITEPADGSSVVESDDVLAGGAYSFPARGEDPTGAGDHPTTQRVEVSVDDADFGTPTVADLHADSGTWSLSLGDLATGEHTLYVRATEDKAVSPVASSTFTVTPRASVQWQVVPRNAATDASSWRTADGLGEWDFDMDTGEFGKGAKTIVVRLVEDGAESARETVRARFR